MTAAHHSAWLGTFVRAVLGLVALAILSDGVVAWQALAPGTPASEVVRLVTVGQATYWIVLAVLAGLLALGASDQSPMPFVVVGALLATAALLSALSMPTPAASLSTIQRTAQGRLAVQNVLASLYIGAAWVGVGLVVRGAVRSAQSTRGGSA